MSHQRDRFSHVTRQFPHHLSWVMKWPAAAWHLAPSLSSASAWSTSRKPCVPTDPPIVCAYVVCHARRGGPAHFPSVKKRGRGRLSFLCSSLLFFFGANYKGGPDNPHGTANTAGTQAFLAFLLQECSLSLFFLTCFSGGWGGGGLVTSSCITSW